MHPFYLFFTGYLKAPHAGALTHNSIGDDQAKEDTPTKPILK